MKFKLTIEITDNGFTGFPDGLDFTKEQWIDFFYEHFIPEGSVFGDHETDKIILMDNCEILNLEIK